MAETDINRYVVKYNPEVFNKAPDTRDVHKIPQDLVASLCGVYKRIIYCLHSSKSKFVAVEIPDGKVEEIKGLDGILDVRIDQLMDLDMGL